MTTRAIVLIPAGTTPADLLQPIAGVPLLLRLLLSAQRAGVSEILLLGGAGFANIRETVLQDGRLLAHLMWLEDQPWSALTQVMPELEKTWWEGDLWVLPARGVVDAMLLRTVAQGAGAQPLIAIAAWPSLSSLDGSAFFRVRGPWLQPILEASGDVPLSRLLRKLPQRIEVEWIPNRSWVCAPMVVEENRAAVERGLFAGLQSASDGWVDRYVNRRLSPWLSRWLLRTPLTPNQVTLMALVMGLMAALSFSHEGWLSGVAGALLLQWSAVVDCCDGEVARLKFLESPSGYYLDIACDNIVHVAVFAGMAWASYESLGHSYPLLLGGLAVFGTGMAFLVVLVTRHGRVRHPSAALDRLIDALTNRDFSVLVLLCALVGKLGWFLWALAIGVNLFWPIVLGLAWKAQRTADG